MRLYSCCFFYRISRKHNNAVIKIEICHKNGWMKKDCILSLLRCYPNSLPARKLRVTIEVLRQFGLAQQQVELLLSRKQVHLDSPVLPLAELEQDLGWNLIPYPKKFCEVVDKGRLYSESSVAGVGLDVSNIIGNLRLRETKGLALKGIVDEVGRRGYPCYLYVDRSTWRWVKNQGFFELYGYLHSFNNTHRNAHISTPDSNEKTADDFMVHWAKKNGQHLITRDELDEYDMENEWLFRGAQRGWPRVHKFYRKEDRIIVPDFGIDVPIPKMY